MNNYPSITINIKNLENNLDVITKLNESQNIKTTFVIKGCNCDDEILNTILKKKIDSIASSRIRHFKKVKMRNSSIKTMLLRLPMISEIDDLIKYTDVSLNSELIVLKHINEFCKKENKTHDVILMVDLGDLREGFWNECEIYETVRYINKNLKQINLVGVGTNLGCFGSIIPTKDKMDHLINIAEKIEIIIGNKLEYVSGGGTTSLPLVIRNQMPSKINHLRIGEGILLGQDLPKYFGITIEGYSSNVMQLDAEIIECKVKPSYPVGKIGVDAFRNTPFYENRGNVIRALLAVGKQDIGSHEKLEPISKYISMVGSSSDHLIVEIENSNINYSIGDILSFKMYYQTMLQCFISDDIWKKYI